MSDRRDDEMEDLSAKVIEYLFYTNYISLFQPDIHLTVSSFPQLSSFECMADQLKAELARKCQVCYFQSQEIQKLRNEVKEVELLSMENESLTVRTRETLYKRRAIYIIAWKKPNLGLMD